MSEWVSEQDYRGRVLDGLQDLRTKMDILVGPNGNNGAFGELDKRVKSLEDTRTSGRAVGLSISVAWAVALAIIMAAIEWFRGK